MDITEIMVGIISLLGIVLTGIIIPLVKAKLNETQLNKLNYWMEVLIAAAETHYQGQAMGEKKKEWVLAQLKNVGLNFDESIVSAAIDGLCRELTTGEVINNK